MSVSAASSSVPAPAAHDLMAMAMLKRQNSLGRKGAVRVDSKPAGRQPGAAALFSPKRESVFKQKIRALIVDAVEKNKENSPLTASSKSSPSASVVTKGRLTLSAKFFTAPSPQPAKGLKERSVGTNKAASPASTATTMVKRTARNTIDAPVPAPPAAAKTAAASVPRPIVKIRQSSSMRDLSTTASSPRATTVATAAPPAQPVTPATQAAPAPTAAKTTAQLKKPQSPRPPQKSATEAPPPPAKASPSADTTRPPPLQKQHSRHRRETINAKTAYDNFNFASAASATAAAAAAPLQDSPLSVAERFRALHAQTQQDLSAAAHMSAAPDSVSVVERAVRAAALMARSTREARSTLDTASTLSSHGSSQHSKQSQKATLGQGSVTSVGSGRPSAPTAVVARGGARPPVTASRQSSRRSSLDSRGSGTVSRGSLDTIPCHSTEEAILARKSERERRMSVVAANRERTRADEETAVLEAIEQKRVAKEEKIRVAEAEERRKLWATAMAAAHFATYIHARLPAHLADAHDRARRTNAATTIARAYKGHLVCRLARLQLRFRRDFKHTEPFWAKFARWWRNRAAANRIVDFLQACNQCTVSGFSPVYARRFIQKVKMVQKCIRSYLACKHARIQALLIQWDRFELKFIKGMFQEAVDRRKKGLVAETSVSGSFLKWHAKRPLAKAVAAAAAADLKARRDAARMSKWSSLEGKIESFVERADGKLSDEQVARSYMVDDTVKRPLVERFLRDARRAVVNEFTEAVRKRFNEMKVVPSYTRDDAMKLLHGDERGMLDRLQRKLDLAVCPAEKKKARQSVPRKPLMLYRTLVAAGALDGCVKRAHQDLRTEVRGRRLAFVDAA